MMQHSGQAVSAPPPNARQGWKAKEPAMDKRKDEIIALIESNLEDSMAPLAIYDALHDAGVLSPAAPAVPVAQISDEQSNETLAELVERLGDMLGPGETDFDNYTFIIKRGNLRRLITALARGEGEG